MFNGISATQLNMLLLQAIVQMLKQAASTSNANGQVNTGQTQGNLSANNPSSFDALITQTSQRYQLDPALVKAVVHAESNFNPSAVSGAGAQGLMQLMPSTADWLGVENAFDPAENLDGGAKFLKQLMDRYDGNVSLALAAYNAGPGAVDRYGGIPPYGETQRYVPKILDLYKVYQGQG